MRNLIVLVTVALMAGCQPQASPEDLAGTWRNMNSGEDLVTLELRRDGSFVRTGAVSGLTVRSAGRYEIQGDRLRLFLDVEQVSGAPPGESKGELLIPFRIDGMSLTLYPDSSRQQQMILVP